MAKLDLFVEAAVKGQENLKHLAGDLDNADKSALSLKDTLKKGAAFGAGFVAAFAAKEVVEFFADAVSAAAEFEDTVSATSVIFNEEATPALEKWAEQAASTFGASKQLALESANLFATMGKSAGLAGDDLTKFSTEMTQLGGDLASFFGGSTEEAVTAIGAALRGESEPIRRYGVLLDDATLRQRALALGIVNTTKKALTPQQKVLAAQAEILAQTSDAQGDFVRTSDGMANTQREVAAEFENLTIEIGEKLLPVMTQVAGFVRDVLIPGLGWLGDFVLEPIAKGIGNLSNSLKEFADQASFIIGPILDAGAAIGDFLGIGEKTDKPIAAISDNLKAGEDAWMSYSTAISTASDTVKDRVRDLTAGEIDAIEEHWDEIRASGSEMVHQYNVGIFEAQTSLQTEIDALLEVLKTRLTPAEEIARLQGQRTALLLAQAARDTMGDQPAVDALQEMLDKVDNQLDALGGFGYDAGVNMVTAIAAGLKQQAALDTLRNSAYAVGGIIRAGVGVESEPKDHKSPLYGITTWGGNIVRTIADGMKAELGMARSASTLLASSLAIGSVSGPQGTGGASDASGGVTVNLTVQGDLRASERTLPGMIVRSLYASGLTPQ